MNPAIQLYFTILATQVCIKEASQPQICVSPVPDATSNAAHIFTGLKFDTSYTITYKVDGVESAPMVAKTQKKTPATYPAPSVQLVVQ